MTFEDLRRRGNWKPIRNCPGRYVLSGVQPGLSPQELVDSGVQLRQFQVDTAKDLVVVARLDGGGLISYQRDDGSYVHTLNTAEGFRRKLSQLGVDDAKLR